MAIYHAEIWLYEGNLSWTSENIMWPLPPPLTPYIVVIFGVTEGSGCICVTTHKHPPPHVLCCSSGWPRIQPRNYKRRTGTGDRKLSISWSPDAPLRGKIQNNADTQIPYRWDHFIFFSIQISVEFLIEKKMWNWVFGKGFFLIVDRSI